MSELRDDLSTPGTVRRRLRRRGVASAAVALTATLALIGAGCTDDSDWQAPTVAADAASSDGAPTAPPEVRVVTDSTDEATAEAFTGALESTMQRYDVAGAAVAVQDPELGDWVATAGVADRDTGEPVTAGMEWPIRSVTKSFTVTMLLQLVDEGAVSLDDTIDQWVDGVPNGESVTLGQLAAMTAGVPEYITDDFVDDFVADTGAPFTTTELIGYALASEPVAEPGEAAIYINTSTLLLGEVIEAETGQGFDEALTERILEPLGLDATHYPTEPEGWRGDHATGYQPDDDGQSAAPTNFTVFGPAGAMVSTVDDLLEWGPALATGALVEADTQTARLEGGPLEEGPEYDTYALGIGELDGWWGHSGEGFGYTALVMHEPERDATVVIVMNLSNAGDHAPTKLFRELAAIIDAA
jgi:D-alanyl-D-alanine carboxypeptidase